MMDLQTHAHFKTVNVHILYPLEKKFYLRGCYLIIFEKNLQDLQFSFYLIKKDNVWPHHIKIVNISKQQMSQQLNISDDLRHPFDSEGNV